MYTNDIMQLVTEVIPRRGMYMISNSCDEYNTVVAFLVGYDMAKSGGVLVAFREWLIPKVGCGNNLAWSELVLRLASPDEVLASARPMDSNLSERAIACLVECLKEFSAERERPNGLQSIVVRYQRWLEHQPWYGSSSPNWLPPEEE